jgi:hypothetical protein
MVLDDSFEVILVLLYQTKGRSKDPSLTADK